MNPSPLTIIWSMLVATSLILGLMHMALWVRHRDSALMFAAVMAIASGFLALNELAMMHATEVGPYAVLLRLSHLPIAGALVAMIWYVNLRLGTGRRGLAWSFTILWS